MGAAHICRVQTGRSIVNRLILLLHSIAIISLFYYRFSCFSNTGTHYHTYASLISWTLLTIADLILTFIWALTQAFRWRPVLRDVSGYDSITPHELPRIDVFICTADPTKEPVLEVMNSVISSMALDYPPEKLAVYLSDDAGSPLTRESIKLAYEFAKHWIPFCNKYGIKTRCPQAFFSALGDDERLPWNQHFLAHQSLLMSKYEAFKTYVEKESGDNDKCRVVQDRAPYVEVIDDEERKQQNEEDEEVKMPMVVYVAREKRPTHPHRFKAGALNALLRVSGVLSNAPYLLVLDCDMFCHDPTSARQSMCFHLDPNMSPSLAFVQYPQIFYNTSKNDIYDGQSRSAHTTKWQGMDGLRGPVLNGTGYYMKKKAVYGSPHNEDEYLVSEPEKAFGSSTRFITSLKQNPSKEQDVVVLKEFTDDVLQEATNLATCTYEANTLWGVKVGFPYDCLLESSYGGYLLHCKGWKSVYLYPKRPCFLGCTTIDMKDAIVQLIKWTSGLLGVGLSKFSPLTYGISRMSVLQSMCYAYITFAGLLAFPLFIYGGVLPLCLLYGIPVFPKVSDPWILGFVFVFVSSHAQHLYEVIISEHSVQQWWNEVRIWIMKALTACLFGSTEAIMKKIGIHRTKFRLTNKVVEKEKQDKYESGKFDFSGAAMLMIPLTILSILNLVSFIGGLIRVIFHNNYDDMFAQLFLSFYLLLLSYPTLQGILAKLTPILSNKP